MASVEVAVTRLTSILAEENQVLSSGTVMRHTDFAEGKNQALRELLAIQRSVRMSDLTPGHLAALQKLKIQLALNGSLLKTHIAALGEVTDIIISGMRNAESDGTYSRAVGSSAW